jgi:hypothetical protein
MCVFLHSIRNVKDRICWAANTKVYIGDPEQFVEYGMKGGIIGE